MHYEARFIKHIIDMYTLNYMHVYLPFACKYDIYTYIYMYIFSYIYICAHIHIVLNYWLDSCWIASEGGPPAKAHSLAVVQPPDDMEMEELQPRCLENETKLHLCSMFWRNMYSTFGRLASYSTPILEDLRTK